MADALEIRVAPPSREAEIAAQLQHEHIDREAALWLLAQLQQAREALDKYGWHKPGCGQGTGDGHCTCGLDAALKAGR